MAALALQDGQVVSTDRLVEMVWGQAAPHTAVNTLQTHISYLRGLLGSKDAILARQPGYLLNLDGDGTDVLTAERLLRHGRQATDPSQGVRDLREALALWRGRPLRTWPVRPGCKSRRGGWSCWPMRSGGRCSRRG